MPTIVLFIWPFLSLVFFAKLQRERAVLASLLTGHLLLPENFAIDLSGLPPINKSSVILVGLLMGLAAFKGKHRKYAEAHPGALDNQSKFLGVLILGALGLLVVNIFFTVATNGEVLQFGPVTLPALPYRDIVTMISNVVIVAMPFVIARKLFSQPESHRLILQYLVIAALAYSALIIIEIRLSPQLHRWVYGYHQHSFAQHIRGGVFRPKVFLEHGLTVGFFLFTTCIAAGALLCKADAQNRTKSLLIFGFLLVILIASKNLGATVLVLLLTPLLWVGRGLQILVITVVTAIFLTYPAMRQAKLLPLDQVYDIAQAISPDRAQSLQYRFDNEDILLERALLKPVSGWGGWNRARVYNSDGRDISTTDGLWIIQLGQQGWLGYIGFFSLLTLPLLLLFRVRKRKEIPIETVAIALIMAGNLIYLIPNATLTPIAWILAGALAGFAQFDPRPGSTTSSEQGDDVLVNSKVHRYTRFPSGHFKSRETAK